MFHPHHETLHSNDRASFQFNTSCTLPMRTSLNPVNLDQEPCNLNRTVNCTRSRKGKNSNTTPILHPSPFTPHSTPCTRHPSPCTLHPEPYTNMNPSHATINPCLYLPPYPVAHLVHSQPHVTTQNTKGHVPPRIYEQGHDKLLTSCVSSEARIQY